MYPWSLEKEAFTVCQRTKCYWEISKILQKVGWQSSQYAQAPVLPSSSLRDVTPSPQMSVIYEGTRQDRNLVIWASIQLQLRLRKQTANFTAVFPPSEDRQFWFWHFIYQPSDQCGCNAFQIHTWQSLLCTTTKSQLTETKIIAYPLSNPRLDRCNPRLHLFTLLY